MTGRTPAVARVEVVPAAGHDSMLLNLSGAHAPLRVPPPRPARRAARGRRAHDAVAMQYLPPGWRFHPKRPTLVR